MVHIVTICILISNGPVATTRPFFYCCMMRLMLTKTSLQRLPLCPLESLTRFASSNRGFADLIRNLIRYKDTLPLMRLRVSARNDG